MSDLQFPEQVKNILPHIQTRPPMPPKWHMLYWLKWKFIIEPKVKKLFNKAVAEAMDEALNGDVLRRRINK